jgi:hypothetical protein
MCVASLLTTNESVRVKPSHTEHKHIDIVVERGARCNCTGTREKVHWVLVPSPEGSSVRRPRYLSEVMTVGGCVSVPSCLWNSTTSLASAYITTTLCPQHQRYPRDTQHSTPKGVSALPQYNHQLLSDESCYTISSPGYIAMRCLKKPSRLRQR